MSPYEEGRAAYAAGKSLDDCRYNVLQKEYNEWYRGYFSWAKDHKL